MIASMKNIDPTLKLVREEIVQVLQKHDCSAFVILSSKTHLEMFAETATWNVAEIKAEGIFIEGSSQRSHEDKEATVGFFFGAQDIMEQWLSALKRLNAVLAKKVPIQHKKFGGPGGFSRD